MCHLSANALKAVNVTGHIGAVNMAELLDELAKRTLALFRESLIGVKKEASGFPSIEIGGLGHISSGSALATEGEELVINFGIDFDIKPGSTRTSRVFKRRQPSLCFEIGAELQIPIVPLGVVAVEFGRFIDVTGM